MPFILNDPPYRTERPQSALRPAIDLRRRDPAVTLTIGLMADAVSAARSGEKPPEGYANLAHMLTRVLSGDARVLLCGSCRDARGLTGAELLPDARRSSMDELAAETITAERVIVVRDG